MKDPLLEKIEHAPTAKELWEVLNKRMEGMAMDQVYTIAVNLIVHAIRMTTPFRGQAEFVVDDLFRRAKNLTLAHYDSVTGKRRSVIPFNQMIKAPFHPSDSQIADVDAR